MKMISSAKFAKASKTIGPARAFGEGAQAVDADNTEGSTKELYLAVTSDRGLCGALHTTICREVEAEMAASAAEEIALVTYGDKGRAYFASKGTEKMLMEFKEAGRNDPTFEDASFMAQEIQAWFRVRIWYHQIQSLCLRNEASPNQCHHALIVI